MRQGNTVFVTQAEYARHRKALGLSGGTREAVRKAVGKKSISVCNGLIDPEIADTEWERNTRRRAVRHSEAAGPDLFGQAAAPQAGAAPLPIAVLSEAEAGADDPVHALAPSSAETPITDTLSSEIEPIELLGRVATGTFDALALKWVQRAMAAYMRAGGEVQLELCFGLPNTTTRRRLMQRNAWLAEAAKHIPSTSSWLGAVELAAELDRFLSRGVWNAWRDLPAPPEGASGLRTALYHVAKANAGKSLSVKQVHRIAGRVFT